MKSKKIVWMFLALLIMLIIVGAIFFQRESYYDENSWQIIISEDCQYFYNGCNRCTRKNGLLSCTEKLCHEYERPKCLD